jgi:hypothetical protein
VLCGTVCAVCCVFVCVCVCECGICSECVGVVHCLCCAGGLVLNEYGNYGELTLQVLIIVS